MRNIRLLLTLSSLLSLAVGGLVACGGDDDSKPVNPGGTDSGATSSSSSSSSSGSTSGGQDSAPPKPTAHAAASSVYLGQTVSLDGSGSTGAGLTYTWTVSGPAGSAITNASIQNATAAKASFVPDKLGDYKVTLTVKSGSDTATADVTIKAVDTSVFFFAVDNSSDENVGRGSFRVTSLFGADRDGGTEVACFSQDAGQGPNVNDTSTQTSRGGQVWSDWWEGPPGQPARAVFAWRPLEGGHRNGRLYSVTSTDTCATPPTSIDLVEDVTDNQFEVFELPRISPNGNRVVYTKQDRDAHIYITTVGLDGKGRHSVAARQVSSTGVSNPDAGRFDFVSPGPRPSWIDDTNLAWLAKDDDSNWQILKAPDAEGAAPVVLLTCTGAIPTDFAVLPNGEILVAQQLDEVDANARAQNIVAYKADGDAGADATVNNKCGAPRNITKIVSVGGGSTASAFSLSPDKTKLAYVQYDDATGSQRVAVIPVDGSSAPLFVGPAIGPTQSPRWIAGGTQITWGASATAIDGGGSGGTAIAVSTLTSDAGGQAIVAGSDARTYTAVSASSCGIGYGFGSALSGVGFLGLLGLGVTRRRRQKHG